MKILLLEPDKEQGEILAQWLKEENYESVLVNDAKDVLPALSGEKFDGMIIDSDANIKGSVIELHSKIKNDTRFSNIPSFILIYKTRLKEIVAFINAGIEGLLSKPFDVEDFLARLKTLAKESELSKCGKKLLDRNYINSLIALTSEADRENFFLISPVIFNKLILDKVKAIIGESVITQIIKRCNETIGEDYAFMKEIRFSDGQIVMDGVDMVSKKTPVKKLVIAFRDYVYAFLHLVSCLTSDILMDGGAKS